MRRQPTPTSAEARARQATQRHKGQRAHTVAQRPIDEKRNGREVLQSTHARRPRYVPVLRRENNQSNVQIGSDTMDHAHQAHWYRSFNAQEKPSVESRRPQIRQDHNNLGGNMHPRLPRINEACAKQSATKNSIQLPLSCTKIPPGRGSVDNIHGQFTIYTQHKGCDENCLPCKNGHNGKGHRTHAGIYGYDTRP